MPWGPGNSALFITNPVPLTPQQFLHGISARVQSIREILHSKIIKIAAVRRAETELISLKERLNSEVMNTEELQPRRNEILNDITQLEAYVASLNAAMNKLNSELKVVGSTVEEKRPDEDGVELQVVERKKINITTLPNDGLGVIRDFLTIGECIKMAKVSKSINPVFYAKLLQLKLMPVSMDILIRVPVPSPTLEQFIEAYRKATSGRFVLFRSKQNKASRLLEELDTLTLNN